MKIRELVKYLSKLDQDKEILVADYYYEDREGFIKVSIEFFEDSIVLSSESNVGYQYEGDPYLFDLQSNLKKINE